VDIRRRADPSLQRTRDSRRCDLLRTTTRTRRG